MVAVHQVLSLGRELGIESGRAGEIGDGVGD